jgi:hypothetical protein
LMDIKRKSEEISLSVEDKVQLEAGISA